MRISDSRARVFAAFILLLGFFHLVRPAQVDAATTKGVVVRRINSCDYYMVLTGRDDYSILEWFGGHDPDKDDVLVGNMKSYGMKTLMDQTAGSETKVWVEDYGLTKEDAVEKLLDKCE